MKHEIYNLNFYHNFKFTRILIDSRFLNGMVPEVFLFSIFQIGSTIKINRPAKHRSFQRCFKQKYIISGFFSKLSPERIKFMFYSVLGNCLMFCIYKISFETCISLFRPHRVTRTICAC